VIPIEMKATSRPRVGDTAHLRLFLDDYGKAAPHGVLLHTDVPLGAGAILPDACVGTCPVRMKTAVQHLECQGSRHTAEFGRHESP